MEGWYKTQIASARITQEGFLWGVHWALLKTAPVLQDCLTLKAAMSGSRARVECLPEKSVCDVTNRSGHDLLVVRGEPVPGTGERYCFRKYMLVQTAETVGVPVRHNWRVPPHYRGTDPDVLDEVIGDVLEDMQPGPEDCGYVVTVYGIFSTLELFGDPVLFHAHARRLVHRAVFDGFTAMHHTRFEACTPDRAVFALHSARLSELHSPAGTGLCRITIEGGQGICLVRRNSLLALRIARPHHRSRKAARRSVARSREDRRCLH